jgi:hypothetical protein
MTKRGNHKSAQENTVKVVGLLKKDVLHAFSLPVDPGIIKNLKNAGYGNPPALPCNSPSSKTDPVCQKGL